jgi:hypothetical protein
MAGMPKTVAVVAILFLGALLSSLQGEFLVDKGDVVLLPKLGVQVEPAIASDGPSYLTVWEDDNTTPHSIRCTRVSSDGEILDLETHFFRPGHIWRAIRPWHTAARTTSLYGKTTATGLPRSMALGWARAVAFLTRKESR